MYNAVVITVSDRSYNGIREDLSGPCLVSLLKEDGFNVLENVIVPDEQDIIKNAFIRLCDKNGIALILTTGGTGFSKRDVTPEATKAVIEKEALGIAEAMRYKSLLITPKAMLSRATSGIRGDTLIINMPGSPKACKECYEVISPALKHGIGILRGDESD